MNRGVVHKGAASVPNGITVRSEPTMPREATNYRTPAPRPGTRWVLERRWASPWLVGRAVFTILWNVMAFSAAASTLARGQGAFVRAFPLPWPHLLLGVALAYACVAEALNTTTIEADGTDVSVVHGPLWWAGGGSVEQSAIERVSAEQGVPVNGRPYHRVELRSGAASRVLKIGGGLHRAEAEYIAEALSAHLQLSV